MTLDPKHENKQDTKREKRNKREKEEAVIYYYINSHTITVHGNLDQIGFTQKCATGIPRRGNC